MEFSWVARCLDPVLPTPGPQRVEHGLVDAARKAPLGASARLPRNPEQTARQGVGFSCPRSGRAPGLSRFREHGGGGKWSIQPGRPLPGQDSHLLEQRTFHGTPGPLHTTGSTCSGTSAVQGLSRTGSTPRGRAPWSRCCRRGRPRSPRGRRCPTSPCRNRPCAGSPPRRA